MPDTLHKEAPGLKIGENCPVCGGRIDDLHGYPECTNCGAMDERNIPAVETPYVVRCMPAAEKEERFFLVYKVVDGRAHMISEDGTKFPGTPVADTLKVVKDIFEVREFNGHRYAKIKAGVISLTTGNMAKRTEILSLFKE